MAVIDDIMENADDDCQVGKASKLLDSLSSFEFVISCIFMKNVLSITHELSQALQKSEQEIINAVKLVGVTKSRLQNMKDNGWNSLLDEVHSFCLKHKIDALNMADKKVTKRSERRSDGMTNQHYYRVELFYSVIDLILRELNDRFSEANTELLRCMSCLHPRSNFCAFDKVKLIDLARFYPNNFSMSELSFLETQLDCYIEDLRTDQDFQQLDGMSALSQKLVEKRKDVVYPLVYKLIKLVLLLPVATASVETIFSAMKLIKTRLKSRMGDDFLNDNLVTYIERDVFKKVPRKVIMQRFQTMKSRKGLLLALEN